MTRSGTVAAALALATMFAAPASAQGARVKAGTLVCNMSPSVGMVVGSRQDLRCRFSGQGRQETYVGSISRAGLDVGVRAGGRLVWAVYASTPKFARRALVGNYAGAAGDVAIGAGLGANVLVGGSNRSVALQPVSVEGTAGVNLAVGVAELVLR